MGGEACKFSGVGVCVGGLGAHFRVGAEVADALGDFGEIVLPVVLVFDGDVAAKSVFANFVEDRDVIDDAGAERAVVRPFFDRFAVLHVK